MLNGDDWLPPMIELSDLDGDWNRFIDAVYARYLNDLANKKVSFKGRPVVLRVHPLERGKGSGFWHCIQEGAIESQRVPDMERCRRIGWIRAIIENWQDASIEYWQETRDNKIDHLFWWREEYLVILSERGSNSAGGPDVYLLKTAYLITQPHSKRKKRKARDDWKSQRRPE